MMSVYFNALGFDHEYTFNSMLEAALRLQRHYISEISLSQDGLRRVQQRERAALLRASFTNEASEIVVVMYGLWKGDEPAFEVVWAFDNREEITFVIAKDNVVEFDERLHAQHDAIDRLCALLGVEAQYDKAAFAGYLRRAANDWQRRIVTVLIEILGRCAPMLASGDMQGVMPNSNYDARRYKTIRSFVNIFSAPD